MIQDNDYKIVEFENYCPRCVNQDKVNEDKELTVNEFCHECLNTPARPNSHKPEKFEERK